MRTAATFLYAAAAAVLLAIALAFAVGGLTPAVARLALGGGLLLGLWSFRAEAPWRNWRWPQMGPWEGMAAVLFTLCSLRAFLWLVFRMKGEVWVLSPNNLGDFSLHLTYIRELANGVSFWPENPIVAGAKLTYPLGVDLLHSLLLLAGADLLRTFIWMGLAGAALTGVALWQWGRGFALLGFLGNGGLAGWALLRTGHLEDYQTMHAWKSLFLALFVTQRGLLFALPAGLLLLCSWQRRFFPEEGGERPLPRWGELLLYAALPVFHLHTFIFLSLLLAAWFLMQAPAQGEILRLIAAAFLPATALVLLVTAGLQAPSLLGWHPGWMQSDPDFLAWCQAHLGQFSPWAARLFFWPFNFGVLPLAVGALFWQLSMPGADRWARAVVFPALGIFLLCLLVKFARWEWDNTKLMLWSYVAVLPALWSHLLARRPWWQQAGAVVLLFGSGLISLAGGLDASHRGYAIATEAELTEVEAAVWGLPASARFLARPNYNHPLLLLGHPVALGYTGHVWSHGYEFAERQVQVEAILNGEGDWLGEARKLGCRYLFWGKQEQEAYPDSPQPWRTSARVLATGPFGTLYDLESSAAPSQTPASP